MLNNTLNHFLARSDCMEIGIFIGGMLIGICIGIAISAAILTSAK